MQNTEVNVDTNNQVRPTSLKEFVGQDHLKPLIQTTVEAARNRNAPFPHTLITGSPGLGKTSLARVIAHEMGVDLVATTAEALEDSGTVKGLLSKLNDSGYDAKGQAVQKIYPSILLVDEAHRLPRSSQELLYAAVEDRVIDVMSRNPITGLMQPTREWVPHFTLVAATNRPGDLTASFRDRLRLTLRLEHYSDEDSAVIVKQTFSKLGVKVTSKAAALIAARGRGVPRRIVGLCEQVRDMAAASKGGASITPAICEAAFQALGLDTLGLNRVEVELLKHLAVHLGHPLGVKTLAGLLGEDPKAVEETIEPYLLSKGLISKCAKGRVLTPDGLQHLSAHHGYQVKGRRLQ